MKWTRKLSLRRKITLVIMVNTVAALCAAGIAFAEYGVYRFKELRVEDLNALANIIGTNSTAPLVFKDPNSARDILQALAAKPHILAAAVYDRDGRPFASYHRGTSSDSFSPPPVEPDCMEEWAPPPAGALCMLVAPEDRLGPYAAELDVDDILP